MPLKYQPKFAKIVELLLHLAHRRPGTDKFQASILFYLADREHLNRHGRPITQDEYFAFSFGPVASRTMDLLEQDRWTMEEAGIDHLPFDFVENSRREESMTVIGRPLREVNTDLFSRSDLQVFDAVLDEYGHCSFEELSHVTRDHDACKAARGMHNPSAGGAPISWDTMIESPKLRAALVHDFDGVAQFLA